MRGSFLGGVLLCLLTLTAAAQSPAKPVAKPAVEEPPLYYDVSGDESAAKFDTRVRGALEQRLAWEYTETKLKDVVADLTKRLALPFELDREGTDEVGVSGDTKITFHTADMTARGALRHFLTDHGLTYDLRHGRVLITNPSAVKATPRLYPIADLVPKPRDLRGFGNRDLDSLIQLITATVQPAAWQDVGGPGDIESVNENALAILVPYYHHHEIAQFLDALRRAQRLAREQPEKFPADGLDVLGTEAIRKKLETVDTFEIDGPLRMLAAAMERKLGVPVAIATRDLDEVGVNSEAECKGSYDKAPIRQGLRALLRPHGLTYYVTPDSVVISNPDAAAKPENLAFRIFYRPHGMDPDSDANAVTRLTGYHHWTNSGGSGSLEPVADQPLFVVRAVEEVMEQVAATFAAVRKIDDWERRLPDFAAPEYETRLFTITWNKSRESVAGEDESKVDVVAVEPTAEQIAQLLGFVRRNVAPDSWSGKEVRMDAWRNQLLIRHKGAVLKEIEALLRELGASPPPSPFGGWGGRGP